MAITFLQPNWYRLWHYAVKIKIMMSEYNSVQMIQSEFPALAYQNETGSNIKQLFLVIQKLADYTKMQLLDDNEAEIEHCYQVAHEILQQGGNISKLAVENVYIYSVSRLLDISLTVSNNSRKEFLRFFRNEYTRQITNNLP